MIDIINWFSEPLSHLFMQRALVVAMAVGVVCAVLSCFVVLKGWSLMGDAVSHAVLPGIVVAFWLGFPMAVGAFVAGLLCSFGVGYLKNHTRIKEDALMGVVFSGMFASGLVLFSKIQTDQHLKHVLFGNLLGVDNALLQQTLWITLPIFLIVMIKRRDFLLYCFDSNHAKVAGLNVPLLHYGLLVLLSATIVSAIQAVGVILVVAMLISPGITAFVLCRRFTSMLIVAIISSCLTCVFGVILSYHLDSATGATIVLLQVMTFVLAVLFAKFGRKIKHY